MVPALSCEGECGHLRSRLRSEGSCYPNGSGRPVQEAASLAVDFEKLSHLMRQLGIPSAGFGDVAVPLLRRQLADGVKE
jgi:hypothetical protein